MVSNYSIAKDQILKLDIGEAKKSRMRGVIIRFAVQGLPCPKVSALLRFSRDELPMLSSKDLLPEDYMR